MTRQPLSDSAADIGRRPPEWWQKKRSEQPARCIRCGGKTWNRLSPDVGIHKACEQPKEDRR